MKRVELAKEAYVFLEDLKNDIQENKEAGYIGYYGFYEDEHKERMKYLLMIFWIYFTMHL